jgi:hypothetical protein
MEITLRKLAILYARDRVTDDQVRKGLAKVTPVALKKENGDTWYEGNQENTVIAVQALIGDEITQEDFEKFMGLVKLGPI